MLAFIVEAALRSLLMALAVWGAIRLLRVQAVIAQKLAWVLVLAAAVTMPFVMRLPWLALNQALAIPSDSIERLPGMHWLAAHLAAKPQATAQQATAQQATLGVDLAQHVAHPKPSASHVSDAAASGRLQSPSVWLKAGDNSFATVQDLPSSIAVLTSDPTRASASATITSAIETVTPAVRDPAHFWTWERIRTVAFAIYFGGVALLLVRMVAGLGLALRIWHRARPTAVPGPFAAGSIRVSRDLNSPVTIGSTVILPSDFAEWDEDKLRVVLAHEQSHVRQGDFYLQLAAALYAAAFWFSPLGWWLQRKISELGEALSDRAGLEQAKDPASYAQILLEFAALPRTSPFTGALTGVAMARTSNLSGRIERILNDRRFRLNFPGGRRHAVLTAVLVPAALVATVACIRIVPSVHAAQSETPVAAKAAVAPIALKMSASTQPASAPVTMLAMLQAAVTGESIAPPQAVAPAPPQVVPDVTAPSVAPAAPMAQVVPDVAAPTAPPAPDQANAKDEADAKDEAPEPAEVELSREIAQENSDHITYRRDGRDESFAIVNGHDTNVNMNGDRHSDFEKAKAKYHDHFIWFERNGKSYVITDPAIVARGEQMFATDPKITVQQKELQARMNALQGEMQRVRPDTLKIDVNTPEFKHQMEELQLRLKDLDKIKVDLNTPEFKSQMEKMQLDLKGISDVKVDLNMKEFQEQMGKLQRDLGRMDAIKIKAMTAKINAEVQAQIDTEVKADVQAHLQEQLGDLQGQIGDVQGQIGEIQGLIGDQQGRLGEKQGEIGERMGKVGEEMGKLGEQQGKAAEAAARRMQSVLDQAVKDGKAKPIE